jgi:hypothetical protein
MIRFFSDFFLDLEAQRKLRQIPPFSNTRRGLGRKDTGTVGPYSKLN